MYKLCQYFKFHRESNDEIERMSHVKENFMVKNVLFPKPKAGV